jgi:hypothetical protein
MSRCLGIPADGKAVAFWPLIDHANSARVSLLHTANGAKTDRAPPPV